MADSRRDFVFWFNSASPHQLPYMRVLSSQHAVTLICEALVKPNRKALGWSSERLGDCSLVVDPGLREIGTLANGAKGAIHLLEGFGGCDLSRSALRVLRSPARVGVISESGQDCGLAGLLRRCKSAIRVRRYSDLVEFVLAMGSIGEKWYIRSGVSQERVFPFCYVVEPPMQGGEVDAPGSTNGVYQVAYLGQMVERKGVDVLIRALARCRTSNWRADFVGSGVGEENFQALSKMCGLADRITFHPALMNRVAMTLLSRADLLVLPSRWDGWGAVVNEALMRGVPVICTSNCGASDLLRHPWLGSVVPAGSVGALADALEQWISRGPRAESESVRIQAWSQCIHPRVVADYFLKIMGHVYDGGPRPEVPWRA